MEILVRENLLSFILKPNPPAGAGVPNCQVLMFERFKVCKNNHTEQSVSGKLNPVFCFCIQHIIAPESSLYIARPVLKVLSQDVLGRIK